jgi:hypothetical protein
MAEAESTVTLGKQPSGQTATAGLEKVMEARAGITSPIEIAYGCLWRTITDDHRINAARNELGQSMTRAQQTRGVEWAAKNLPAVTDGEIARIDL